MAIRSLEERRRDPEDEMVALYVHLLQKQGADEDASADIALAEPCPHCGGPLMFRRMVLSCAHCCARVAA